MRFALVIALCLLSLRANAAYIDVQINTGEMLLANCGHYDAEVPNRWPGTLVYSPPIEIYCDSFIIGVISTYEDLNARGFLTESICPDHDYDIVALREAVVDYIKANGEALRQTASFVVYSALRQLYPCSHASPEKSG